MAERRPNGVAPFSQRFLLSRLEYHPATGALFWRLRPASVFSPNRARTAEQEAARWNKRYAGRRAGREPSGSGTDCYRKITLAGKRHAEHRIIWMMVHGEWPDQHVDHRNGIKTDNRIENLRLTTPSQNSANTKASWGRSRYRGVARDGPRGWRASLMHQGNRFVEDGIRCETAAAIARDRMAQMIAGKYHRLNIDGG